AVTLATGKVLFGLALVENASDEPYRIVAAPPDRFHDTDRELLTLSNSLLPRIPFEQLDVLVVDWIGKNISGSGMDPNVIGMWRPCRSPWPATARRSRRRSRRRRRPGRPAWCAYTARCAWKSSLPAKRCFPRSRLTHCWRFWKHRRRWRSTAQAASGRRSR